MDGAESLVLFLSTCSFYLPFARHILTVLVSSCSQVVRESIQHTKISGSWKCNGLKAMHTQFLVLEIACTISLQMPRECTKKIVMVPLCMCRTQVQLNLFVSRVDSICNILGLQFLKLLIKALKLWPSANRAWLAMQSVYPFYSSKVEDFQNSINSKNSEREIIFLKLSCTLWQKLEGAMSLVYAFPNYSV